MSETGPLSMVSIAAASLIISHHTLRHTADAPQHTGGVENFPTLPGCMLRRPRPQDPMPGVAVCAGAHRGRCSSPIPEARLTRAPIPPHPTHPPGGKEARDQVLGLIWGYAPEMGESGDN